MSVCNRGRDELYDNVYRAVLMCKLAGLSFAKTKRIVREVFGVIPKKTIPRSMLRDLYYRRSKYRLTKLNALDKSLWYHEAYSKALKLKDEHPSWGHKKIASELNRCLPIRVPPMTVYYWITSRSSPSITPVKICPELGYLVGVLVGDWRRASHGLRVKDEAFAEHYVRMYEKVTGVKPKIALDKEGFYNTRENGAFLKTMWKTGLWKVVAHIYPRQFLQGLFDSEGSISPNISRFSSYTLEIWTANNEVLNLAMTLLKKLGYRTSIYVQPPRIRIFHFPRTRIARTKQRCYALIVLGGQDALYKFASEIGFREGKRRKRLAALLEAFKHPPKERQKVYRKILNTLPHTPPF